MTHAACVSTVMGRKAPHQRRERVRAGLRSCWTHRVGRFVKTTLPSARAIKLGSENPAIWRRVLPAPLHKPSEPISKSSAKGLEAPFSIGRISPPSSPSKKSEECKKQFLLGELLFLGGSNSSHSARLQPAYFVFPSRTQKAADENRSSQKPPAAWICAGLLATSLC